MGSYVKTRAGLLHWSDYGGARDLIVLVHGLGGSAMTWDAVGPRLATLGRTIALDLPGFGLSPPGPDWELSTHATAIRDFVGEFGQNAILVGNSMGGLLAEIVASESPSLVAGLALISPATPPRLPDPRIHWPTARRLALQATPLLGPAVSRRLLKSLSPEELVRLSLQSITHRPNRVPVELVSRFISLARTRRQLPWAADAVPMTGRSIAKTFRKPSSFVEMIRDIRCPTLVVHGLRDHIVSPTSVEWMCSLRTDWELTQMEDTGHTPQLDAPVRLLEVLAPWLERTLERETTA